MSEKINHINVNEINLVHPRVEIILWEIDNNFIPSLRFISLVYDEEGKEKEGEVSLVDLTINDMFDNPVTAVTHMAWMVEEMGFEIALIEQDEFYLFKLGVKNGEDFDKSVIMIEKEVFEFDDNDDDDKDDKDQNEEKENEPKSKRTLH